MTHKLTQGDHVLKVDTLARVEGEGAMHIVVHDDVHGSLALDPGQGVHLQDVIALSELVRHGATSWCRTLCALNGSAPALKVRKMRSAWVSSMPSTRRRSARDWVFGVSCGPKHP